MDRFSGNSYDGPRPRLGLAVLCSAQFVVVLDATIVATALPSLRSALGFSPVDLPWVITAYTLVFGSLLITGGRVADLLGPRRAFHVGLLVFVAASAGCAFAFSPAVLVGARAVQGLGAALLSPAALALLTVLSDAGPVRRRAVGWWTAAAAGGGASGWVLGGLLTQYLGWRTVFWVNVPIGLAALAVAAHVLPAGRRRRCRLDIGGTVAVTAAFGLLVYGLNSIGERGLLQVTSWAPVLLAGCISAVLARHLRRAADPLLPPRLLQSRTAAGANLTALALTAATTPAMYLSILYVHQVLRLPPARASMLFPVFNLAVIAGSLTGPASLRRVGPRRTLLAGFAGVGAGTVVLAGLPSHGMPIGQLLAAFAMMGAGLGGAAVASTHVGIDVADRAYEGVAAGVLNAAAQVGTAFGLAIVAPLATTAASAATDGYRTGFIGTCTLVLAGLLASLLLPPHQASGRQDHDCPTHVGAHQTSVSDVTASRMT